VRFVAAILTAAFVAVTLAVRAFVPAAITQTPPEWRTFEGTWSATGHRQTLPTERSQPAVIAQLSGAVSLTAGEGLSRGFRGEAIWFGDGSDLNAGRAVWTDEKGDRIYSILRGEALESRRRITATITGGSGRYTGATGEYAFEWQYVVEAEGGAIQGRAVGLRGRIRAGGSVQ
jgi:hypothetical protein